METNQKYDGMSITGFIFGILSLLAYFILVFAPFCAIIFSSIGLAKTKSGEKKGKGLAIAGLILGIVYSVLIIINVIFSMTLFIF